MEAECTPKLFEFEAVERRMVIAIFDIGSITSNAGAPHLGQIERGPELLRWFASASPTGAVNEKRRCRMPSGAIVERRAFGSAAKPHCRRIVRADEFDSVSLKHPL